MTDLDHAHGAARGGEPPDRFWCDRCGVHRVQTRDSVCPVCVDELAEQVVQAMRQEGC